MKFENKHLIGRGISIIHRYTHIFFTEELKDLSIGKGQYMLLMSLYHHDGIKQDDLVKRMKLDKANVARGIKKLEDEGYVLRKVDENDKRAYRLYVTEKGLEIKPKIYESFIKWNNIITQDLSEEEVNTCLKIIEKMAANACEYLGDKKLADHLRNKR